MIACPRAYCGGSRLHYGGQVQCVLCGRGMIPARARTAEESAEEESAGEAVRYTAKLLRAKTKRRRVAAALKASRAALNSKRRGDPCRV